MKALNQFSASVPLLFLLLLVMMMAMTVQTSCNYLFGDANVDPKIPPRVDNGVLYYMREDSFSDIKTALQNCAADGAKLVEIGSWSEFDLLDEYLKSISAQGKPTYTTYIGGQYQPAGSQWIFPTAARPLPFFNPSTSLVNFDPSLGDHCLVLRYDSGTDRYSMHPARCTIEGFSTLRYMCEKIYAPYY